MSGYNENLKPLQSLGYKQMIGFLRNQYGWESSVYLIKRYTWHYAKRQMTWFAADKEINWFGSDSFDEIRKNAGNFLKENGLL